MTKPRDKGLDGFGRPLSYAPRMDMESIRKFYAGPLNNMGMANGIREARVVSFLLKEIDRLEKELNKEAPNA